MNSSVFISYSSKQKTIADCIKHYLEEYRISCWMAPDSIPPSSSYPEEINKAIAGCEICLLVYSNTASLSPWVKKEVNQAINMGKAVLPFRIEETKYSDFFDFILSDTHWIEAYPHYADKLPPLLKAICAILRIEVPLTRLTESNKDDYPLPIEESKDYSIGDVIYHGQQKGVVFYLDSSLHHGKIVATDSSIKQWCTRSEYLTHRDTKSVSDDDGLANLKSIQQIPDWELSYPSFKWCSKKGDGWYLPTIEDYRLIDKNRDRLFDKIDGINVEKWFWSSEQESVYSAKYYHFLSGQSHSAAKDNECSVLAIADF